MRTIIITSGGFAPAHSGHIECFNAARLLGDKLIVGVNSDEWLLRKHGKTFMTEQERLYIIGQFKSVDESRLFDDTDGSAKQLILDVLNEYPNDKIVFAKGGDRTSDNIPEMDLIKDYSSSRLEFVFGVGGTNKKNSSSLILRDYIEQTI